MIRREVESVKDEEESQKEDSKSNELEDVDAAPMPQLRCSAINTVIPVKKKKNTKEDDELEEIKQGIRTLTPNYYKSIFFETNALDNMQMFTNQIESIIKDAKENILDKSVAGFLICANMDVSRYQRVDWLVYLNSFARLTEEQKQRCADLYQNFVDLLSQYKNDPEHEHFKNVSMLFQCMSYFQRRMIETKHDGIKNKLNNNLCKHVNKNNSLFNDVKRIYSSVMSIRSDLFHNLEEIKSNIDDQKTIEETVYYPLYLLFKNIPINMFDAPVALENNNKDTNYVIALKHMLANCMSNEDTFYNILKRIDTNILKTLTNLGELQEKFSEASDLKLNWVSFCDLITIISKEYMKQQIEDKNGKIEITNNEALKFCRDNGISKKLVSEVKTCLEYQVPYNRILIAYKWFLDSIKETSSKNILDNNIMFEMMAMSPVYDNVLLQNVVNKNSPWLGYYFDPIRMAQQQRELLVRKRNRLSRWRLLRRHGLQQKIDFLDRELRKVLPNYRTQEARNQLRGQQIANNAQLHQPPQIEANTNKRALNNNFIYSSHEHTKNNEALRQLLQENTDQKQQQPNNNDLYGQIEKNILNDNSNLLMAKNYQDYIDNITLTGCCSSYAY